MGIGRVVSDVKQLEREEKKAVIEGPCYSVVKYLNANLPHVEVVEPMTQDSWVRASSIPRLCFREEVLAGRAGLVREKQVHANLEWWFGMGDGIHYTFQSRYLGKLGVLYGHWMCLMCGKVHGRNSYVDHPVRVRMPEECDSCGHTRFFLVEETVEDPERRINGHMDGVLRLPGNEDAVIDFKSCSKSRFQRLKKRPDEAAVVQLQMYMAMSGIKRGVLLYVNKQESFFDGALAEHWFDFDEGMVRHVWKEIEAVREGLRGGSLPERVCAGRDEKRAVECPCRELCFPSDGA